MPKFEVGETRDFNNRWEINKSFHTASLCISLAILTDDDGI
jgi:hypothetical protein